MLLSTVEEIRKKGVRNIKDCPSGCPGGNSSIHGNPCVECGGYTFYDHSYGYNHNTEEEYEIMGVDVEVKCSCSQGSSCKRCKGIRVYVHTFTTSGS